MTAPRRVLVAAGVGKSPQRPASVRIEAKLFTADARLLTARLEENDRAQHSIGMVAAQRGRRPIALGLPGVMLNALSVLI